MTPMVWHQGQNGHAKNEEEGGRGRTGAGAVEREGEIGNRKGVLVGGSHRLQANESSE